MSVSHHAPSPVEAPQFWTLAGLASWFSVSEATIMKYIAWRLIPPALGKHQNGFNYDQSHFDGIAKIRAERERYIPLSQRKHRPHIIIRTPRLDAS